MLVFVAGCASQPLSRIHNDDAPLQRIQNVVVIYAENHSFDNLYGLFPGANGIAQATAQQKIQWDHDDTPLPELLVFGKDGKPDPKYPRLPNQPFRIDAPPVNRPPTVIVPQSEFIVSFTKSRSTVGSITGLPPCPMLAGGPWGTTTAVSSECGNGRRYAGR